MRTRAIQNGNIVWFGSTGKNLDGTAQFYDDKKNSFSNQQQAVVDSLTQRLSVIKSELWYRVSYGLPLYEKTKSKPLMDSSVLEIVKSHQDVVNVLSFSSQIVNKKYTCKLEIQSIYGNISLSI